MKPNFASVLALHPGYTNELLVLQNRQSANHGSTGYFFVPIQT